MNDEITKQTILIVDDVAENIDILVEILSPYYRVKAASNGSKALEITASDDPPDLILLDVAMPRMDGLEVCRRIKASASTARIPVIFVSAKGEVTDETAGFEAGAVDYINKPVSPPLVRARVKTQLELYDQNRTLEGKVTERTAELRAALEKIKTVSLETIVRLSRAAEFKDEDTGAHILRMSHYAKLVARRLGLDEEQCENLLHAAPMHDIGKIGIPDKILLKPGKLDADEWKIMKLHCQIGARILSGSDSEVVRLGEVIAFTHHEKWDGNGYPRGLKGEAIPLSGRIVAIADVFDALTSKRPYKEPFSVEKSFAIIREGKGTHFDPQVVEAFFFVEKEILDIKERYKDDATSYLFSLAEKGQA